MNLFRINCSKLKKLFTCLLFSINLCGCSVINNAGSPNNVELSRTEITNRLKKSIVKVLCYDYSKQKLLTQGTGFFIDNNGTFVTNFHVVDDSYNVKIKISNGTTKWVSKINIYEKKNSDYAICAVNGLSSDAVVFNSNYENDDTVYSLGFPHDASSLVQTVGKITRKEVVVDGKKYIENNATIDHGSSGGILADKYGNVIGITSCEFDNNKYGAVPYESFRQNLNSKKINKDPLHCFHSVQTASLTKSMISTYFTYSFLKTSDYGTSTACKYYVRLKNPTFGNIYYDYSLYISFEFSLTYSYYFTNNTSRTYTQNVSRIDGVYFYEKDRTNTVEGFVDLSASISGSIKITAKSQISMTPHTATGTLDIVS